MEENVIPQRILDDHEEQRSSLIEKTNALRLGAVQCTVLVPLEQNPGQFVGERVIDLAQLRPHRGDAFSLEFLRTGNSQGYLSSDSCCDLTPKLSCERLS